MTDEFQRELVERLGRLDENMKGFHRRQDIANGRQTKVEDRVGNIEKENVSQDSELHEIKKMLEKQVKDKEKWGGRVWAIASPFIMGILIALWLTIKDNIQF